MIGPGGIEPDRRAPDSAVGARYAALARRDTRPEIALRRELHRRGHRYRVEYAVPGLPRRRVDIAFTRVRLAVMVDGCFWHHCPIHGVLPTTNQEWWQWKFAINTERDRDTDRRLDELGWTVVRIWEHVKPVVAVEHLEALLEELRGSESRE